MKAEEFFEIEDPLNNKNYDCSDIDTWLFDKTDMIRFAERYHKEALEREQSQALNMHSVSHQRGLLESFRDWLNNTKTSDNNINNGDLDDFLEDYNCG